MSITTVGIIGAGTMGNGIAQACATSGINVIMVDVSQAAVAKGISTVSGSLDRLLKKEKIANKLTNLKIMPFQDYEILPKILASADVLLSILENDAAIYSVPSKVLTYLCSNRPIILSVSSDNLAVKTIEESNAGYFIDPGSIDQLVDKIKILSDNPELQSILGINGRLYAEANFNISKIGNRFIKLFNN